MLFTAVNAVAKSFMQESAGRQLYYYTLANPRDIMLSKIIYNIFIMLFWRGNRKQNGLGLEVWSLIAAVNPKRHCRMA